MDGPTMALASRNIGDVSVFGADLNAVTYLSEDTRFSLGYSYVSKDSISVPGAQFGFVALNAPKHKLRISADHGIGNTGINLGLRFRWNDGFPANSGTFVGYVDPRHEIDVNVAWRPPFHEALLLNLSMQNVYNNATQFFVGTPQIGRTTMLRLSYTL